MRNNIIQKVANLFAPILRLYRYQKMKDPFSLFINLKKKVNFPNNNKNILLLPIRVSPTSNTFEGILGYALKLRGYSVNALMCGQSLTKCENVNQKNNFALSCALCKLEQKKFSEAFDINNIEYLDLVSKDEYNNILSLSKNTNLEDIFNYRYKNVPIGKYVEGGVSRYLLISNIDLIVNENIIREYFLTALLTAEATIQSLEKYKPKFVIASHGIYSTWGTAVETCITYGYNVIVWGRGYIGKGNIVASHNSSYLFETINESTDYWINDCVSDKIKQGIDAYFINKRNPNSGVDYVSYYADIKQDKISVLQKLNLNQDRKRIGIYPNIPWDGKMFSATEDFPDLNVFVKYIIEWANLNPDVDMIIRSHPAEAFRKGNESIEKFIDIINMECHELPSNVIYIEPTSSISSYELSEVCDAALMYASTLALEFSYARHPVIQVGLSNVSNKGIVFDAFTKEAMFSYLNMAVEGKLKVDEEMYLRVLKYSNYWINKRHIPEVLMNLKNLAFDGYMFNNSLMLDKDNFEVLDWFIDRCEDGKPFIWEE